MTVICDECGSEMETEETAGRTHSIIYSHTCPDCGEAVIVRAFR